ncbi:hypothetical protein BC830DRAFT_1148225 [Chytriomyces sp. MP71]|nr:hypothetical protein BC830DRAFT_1148225 [Chytriomyces sp. MP71]
MKVNLSESRTKPTNPFLTAFKNTPNLSSYPPTLERTLQQPRPSPKIALPSLPIKRSKNRIPRRRGC